MYELDADTAIKLIITATTKAKEEKARDQWLTLYPFMALKLLKNVSLSEYMDLCTGRNIDWRSTEDIIRETEEAIKRLERAKNG